MTPEEIDRLTNMICLIKDVGGEKNFYPAKIANALATMPLVGMHLGFIYEDENSGDEESRSS